MGVLSAPSSLSTLLSLFLFLFCILQTSPVAFAKKKSYIVYLGEHSHSLDESNILIRDEKVKEEHHSFLGSVLGSKKKARDAIFDSCTRHINAFAANLEEDEAMEISKRPEVISVFLNKAYKLHTTHSWSFLGLEREDGSVPEYSIWTKANYGRDVIIGVLDTGVWPESESFNDRGMGPIPSRWKGTCQTGSDPHFNCNRKLIGARYFNKNGVTSIDSTSPRDIDGHGTHCMSTAGGRSVPGANYFGFGNGTAKGGSPEARVASYKVCATIDSCFDNDILHGFDMAISDGVDVLSVSLGSPVNNPMAYYGSNVISIGSYHAVKMGITVVCAAGNDGPTPSTVENVAPWIFTVGASTMDREFLSIATLGNGIALKGQSLSDKMLPEDKLYPLISSVDAISNTSSKEQALYCTENSLDPTKVKGKIVACLRYHNSFGVKEGMNVMMAEGLGMIFANDVIHEYDVEGTPHVLPATHISYSDGVALFSYINTTKSPMAYISYPKTVIGTKPAPLMAAFSSRGPNVIDPEFLKPDITAPGVSVIAAYSEVAPPARSLPSDHRREPFKALSGTSMSCPHVAGVVGLLKSMHPSWSPAGIRSAIMTTATTSDNTGMHLKNSSYLEATPFSYGAGHLNPNQAMDPGLLYDIPAVDYFYFMCTYNSVMIMQSSNKNSAYTTCPTNLPRPIDMNYPSITIPHLSGHETVMRRVKNVGSPGKYMVRVEPPKGVSVVVDPTSLEFNTKGEEKSFTVTFNVTSCENEEYVYGKLIWSDGKHYVTSPLVVHKKKKTMR